MLNPDLEDSLQDPTKEREYAEGLRTGSIKEKEPFDPSNPNYKKIADLPESERGNFVDTEGGGFVGKEASRETKIAQILELTRTTMLTRGEPSGDLLQMQAQRVDEFREKTLAKIKESPGVAIEPKDVHKFLEYFSDDATVMSRYLAGASAWVLVEASPRLRNDKDFIMRVINEKIKKGSTWDAGRVLLYASEKLKRDKDLVMFALSNASRGGGIELFADKVINEAFKNDVDVVYEAFKARKGEIEGAVNPLNTNLMGDELKAEIAERDRIIEQGL